MKKARKTLAIDVGIALSASHPVSNSNTHYFRWRIRARIRRFFRPTLRRPAPRLRPMISLPTECKLLTISCKRAYVIALCVLRQGAIEQPYSEPALYFLQTAVHNSFAKFRSCISKSRKRVAIIRYTSMKN